MFFFKKNAATRTSSVSNNVLLFFWHLHDTFGWIMCWYIHRAGWKIKKIRQTIVNHWRSSSPFSTCGKILSSMSEPNPCIPVVEFRPPLSPTTASDCLPCCPSLCSTSWSTTSRSTFLSLFSSTLNRSINISRSPAADWWSWIVFPMNWCPTSGQ